MITGEIKNKVDKIWEIFWSGGVANPLTVIEQFTYLLFIKGLDEKQNSYDSNARMTGQKAKKIFSNEQQHLRWGHFKNEDSETMFSIVSEEVFKFIKAMHSDKESSFSKYMQDAIFLIPTPAMLQKIVQNIDEIDMSKKDVKGDLYEYLLSKVAQAGTNGQFRTPRHIIDMMVEMMKPTPTDTILDPAAGSAGFLVSAGEYLKKNNLNLFKSANMRKHYHETMFYGFDMDRTMLRIGAMNMMLHGVENPNIEYRDSLSEANSDRDKYSLILANPPFKGALDYEGVSKNLLKVTKTKKTELLFLALMLRSLNNGGRCATIVPDGVLSGTTKAHVSIKKEIIENNKLAAVISMPSGVFKPYAGVCTAILIFTKTKNTTTDEVWFYEMTSDGYSLDDKRTKIGEGNGDISDIINRFKAINNEKNRSRTEQSFLVPVEEIRDNNYDLSMNLYKDIEFDNIQYAPPLDILKEIKTSEELLLQRINSLEELLNEK